MQNKGY